ncbi:hypothetical protein LJ739_16515 [Aestuariibacter halophilus]|uniref:Uncharacterized protein n=1 Tax=Fluctibacter halophilus TaxID=226011 RepID=A0ABS8GB87_9ALTE|nr:hypothetical protein [Aestuariibacter halophilus]MCC2617857.1 hypothetical protein [Aestuariibacter halophilus]
MQDSKTNSKSNTIKQIDGKYLCHIYGGTQNHQSVSDASVCPLLRGAESADHSTPQKPPKPIGL